MLKPSKDTTTSSTEFEANKDNYNYNFVKNNVSPSYSSYSPTKNYINNIPNSNSIPKRSRPPLPKSS
jgi:hypothetical protein